MPPRQLWHGHMLDRSSLFGTRRSVRLPPRAEQPGPAAIREAHKQAAPRWAAVYQLCLLPRSLPRAVMHNARAGAPTKQQLSRERPARGAGAPAGVPRASRIADPWQPGQPAQLHAHPGFPAASHPHPWGSARRCASPLRPRAGARAPPKPARGPAPLSSGPGAVAAPSLGARARRPPPRSWILMSPLPVTSPRSRGGSRSRPGVGREGEWGSGGRLLPASLPAASRRSQPEPRRAPRRAWRAGAAAGMRRRCGGPAALLLLLLLGPLLGPPGCLLAAKGRYRAGRGGCRWGRVGDGLAPAPCPQLFRPEVWGDAGSGAERGGSHLGCAPGSAAAPRCSAAELGRSARLAARPYELLRFVFAVRGRSPFFSSRVRGKLQLALSFVGLVCLPRMIARWPTSGGQWFFVALTFSKLRIAESKPRKRVGTCGATAACPGGAGRSGATAASLAANK